MTRDIATHPDEAKTEIMSLRLTKGTHDRIFEVLRGGEIHAAFVRTAIENELRMRKARVDRGERP